jgi:outer membrane biosynthesis protein TonB
MRPAKRLKVYRTPIGFHDAYVAAPSQKAALAAWGVDHNLFAKGMADVVTDPDLAKEPLSQPGTVVKRLRGTAAEQLAALSSDPPRRAQTPREEHRRTREPKGKPRPSLKPKPPPKPKPKPNPKHKPRPSRSGLDRAEEALSLATARQDAEAKTLAAEEAELARRRRALNKDHAAEVARLERSRDRARAAYIEAMRKWRG